jgi:hypothetical protein
MYRSEEWRALVNDYERAFHRSNPSLLPQHNDVLEQDSDLQLVARKWEQFVVDRHHPPVKRVKRVKRAKRLKQVVNRLDVDKQRLIKIMSTRLEFEQELGVADGLNPTRKWTGSKLLAFSRDTLPLLYSFLSLRGLCMVAGVCRMWYRALCTPRLLDRLFYAMAVNRAATGVHRAATDVHRVATIGHLDWPSVYSVHRAATDVHRAATKHGHLFEPEAVKRYASWVTTIGHLDWPSIYSRLGRIICAESQHLTTLRKLQKPINSAVMVHEAAVLPTFCLMPPHVRLWLRPAALEGDGVQQQVKRKHELWMLVLHLAEPTRAEVFVCPCADRPTHLVRHSEFPTFWPRREMHEHLRPECMMALHPSANMLALPMNRRDIRRQQTPIRIAIHYLSLSTSLEVKLNPMEVKTTMEVKLPSTLMDVEMMQFRGEGGEGARNNGLLFIVGCNTGEVLVWEVGLAEKRMTLRWHLCRPPYGLSEDETKQWRRDQIQNYRFLFHFGFSEYDDLADEIIAVRLRQARRIVTQQLQSSAFIADYASVGDGPPHTVPPHTVKRSSAMLEWRVLELVGGRTNELVMPVQQGEVDEIATVSVKSNPKVALLQSIGGRKTEDLLLVRRTDGTQCLVRNVRHDRVQLTATINAPWNNQTRRMSIEPKTGLWSIPGQQHIVVVHLPTLRVLFDNANQFNASTHVVSVSPLQGNICHIDPVFSFVFYGGGISIRSLANLQSNLVDQHPFIPPLSAIPPLPWNHKAPVRPTCQTKDRDWPASPIVAWAATDRYMIVAKDTGAIILTDLGGNHTKQHVYGGRVLRVGDPVSYDGWFYGMVRSIEFGEVRVQGAPLFVDIVPRLMVMQKAANKYDEVINKLLKSAMEVAKKNTSSSGYAWAWSGDLQNAKDRLKNRIQALYGHFFLAYPKDMAKKPTLGEIVVALHDPKLVIVEPDHKNSLKRHNFVTFALPDLKLYDRTQVLTLPDQAFAQLTPDLHYSDVLHETTQVQQVIGPVVLLHSHRFACTFAIQHNHPALPRTLSRT